MKFILTVFILLFTSLMGAQKEKQLVQPDIAIKLLETIKDNAIVLGNGQIEVHAFIDPLCPMSKRYLDLLYKRNNKIFSKYTIYLYLHEIKSKKSKKHILNIMSAESRETRLRDIMLSNKKFDLTKANDEKSINIFKKIAEVANKIGVYKRPYIMINGKVK